jgi:hypothetical protein
MKVRQRDFVRESQPERMRFLTAKVATRTDVLKSKLIGKVLA